MNYIKMLNMPIWKCIFIQKYFKLFYPAITNNNFLTTTVNLCEKKKLKIKNKFTFKNKYRENVNAEHIFSEQRECEEKRHNSSLPFKGFVSDDLLLKESNSNQQKNKLYQKQKSRTPPLTYKGEILFGVHPVYLALSQRKRILHHLYAREDLDSSNGDDISRKNEIIRLAQSVHIPVTFLDGRGLKILAPGAVHQGVCLDAGFLPLSNWTEDQSEVETTEKRPIWLVLDEILDPMNVGAIIRSAHYFGVKKLFTVRGNSCKLSPTVSKASSGALEVMNIFEIENLESFVKKRKDNGWCIVSTLAYSENQPKFTEPVVSVTEFSTSKPTILILGNEGRGISENVLMLCDSLISIQPGQTLPQGIDSLNVSVAAGVLLYILNSSSNSTR